MKRLIHAVAGPVGRLRVFAALTIGSAAAISFDSIRHLAEVAGFGPLAWLFPLTLDAVAAYGMDLWVRRSPAARAAKWLALAAIFGSLVANVVDHWLSQRSILGAVLGAVPPAMLAALLAVAHRHSTGSADRKADQTIDPAVRDAVWSSLSQAHYRSPGPVYYSIPDQVFRLVHSGQEVSPDQTGGPMLTPVPDRPVQRRRSSAARKVAGTTQRTARLHSDDEVRTWIKDQTERPTKQAVRDRFGMGSSKALRLINDVKGPISRG